MEFGLMIVFWYGMLHALAPDHLSVIADFSIGKSVKKTFIITLAFALGHGLMLFIFAKLLSSVSLPHWMMEYGDTISSMVIMGIGLYLVYMATSNKIHLRIHEHNEKKHIHIWFGKEHSHTQKDLVSALSLGALMGVGGVRGMMITLGMLESKSIDFTMIALFVLGVSLVFMLFGLVLLYINKRVLTSQQNVRKVFATAGLISLAAGGSMILG